MFMYELIQCLRLAYFEPSRFPNSFSSPFTQCAASESPSSSQGAGLNVVANRVVDESSVVLGVNSSSDARSAIVLGAGSESGGVESVNGIGICGLELAAVYE